jgi:hypothetical protein
VHLEQQREPDFRRVQSSGAPLRSQSMIADDIETLDPQELRERLRKADAQLAF